MASFPVNYVELALKRFIPNKELIYIGGRLAGLAVRPMVLLFATQYLLKEVPLLISLSYLICGLGLMLTAADSHRLFYLGRFSNHSNVNGISYYTFVFSMIVLLVFGGVAVSILCLFYHQPFMLILATLAYFISEKLMDEVLRFRIFEKDFCRWGALSISKAALQVFLIVLAFIFFKMSLNHWHIIFILFFANAIVLFFELDELICYRSIFIRATNRKKLFFRASKTLWLNKRIWLFTILISGWGYVDRVIASTTDRNILPVFTLVVFCFALIPTIFDFFYLSKHRAEFLRGELGLTQVFFSKAFLICMFCGLLVAMSGSVLIVNITKGGEFFPIFGLPALALIYMFLSLTHIPHQLLYWSNAVSKILNIEVFSLFVGASLLMLLEGTSLTVALLGLLFCILLRFTLYIFFCPKNDMQMNLN